MTLATDSTEIERAYERLKLLANSNRLRIVTLCGDGAELPPLPSSSAPASATRATPNPA